jgi:hypothetical protein
MRATKKRKRTARAVSADLRRAAWAHVMSLFHLGQVPIVVDLQYG